MKSKFMWIIIAILVVEFFVYRSMQEEDKKMSTEYFTELANVSLNNNNNSNYEIIEYINQNNYEVEISTNSIEIDCLGYGVNKEEDEYLVSNNFKIDATFSKEMNGNRFDSLTIGENEKTYIHINSSYIGDEYPQNEVSCRYNINIDTV